MTAIQFEELSDVAEEGLFSLGLDQEQGSSNLPLMMRLRIASLQRKLNHLERALNKPIKLPLKDRLYSSTKKKLGAINGEMAGYVLTTFKLLKDLQPFESKLPPAYRFDFAEPIYRDMPVRQCRVYAGSRQIN